MKKPTTSGYAAVNGLEMYYEIYGSGNEPLVLIHGGGSTIQTTFGNMLPLLSDHKIIAVELQAHGRTTDRDAAESFEQDADDVAALLKYLRVDKANILGFSNGGSTAMQIAIRHPDLVNKIIVISGLYKREGLVSGFFEGLQYATLNDLPTALKDAFLEGTPDANRLQVMFNKDKERMLTFKDWSDNDLRGIKTPALLMSADHDVIMPEHTLKMAQLIPNARLAILPANHSSIIGEAGAGGKLYKLTALLVTEFLNE